MHHLIADNVWRGTAMLQEALERCGKDIYMDVGEMLIELATEAQYRDKAIAAHPGRVSTVIHNTSHPKYDECSRQRLELFSLQTIGSYSEDRDDWKNTDCSQIKTIVLRTARDLRENFLNNVTFLRDKGLLAGDFLR